MTLSHEAQRQISQLKTHFINASEKRLENPSDFDAIVMHFRELELGTRSMQTFINSYVDVKDKGELVDRMIELQKFLDEVNSLKDCDELQVIRNQLLEKESRITELRLDLKSIGKLPMMNCFFRPELIYTPTYSIKFSDGDVISCHSFDDVMKRQAIRAEFDRKMEMLASEYRPASGM
ncbi:MAG: hypothetical protein SFW66_10305 [Gammaproteobacteria bacterium]|nr:hypothetical protein [Gammaproteobacteria bacterium]